MFTVLIPAYNTGKYISDAIISACNQTYKDWEVLVVVDEGTTDDTYEAAVKCMNSVNQKNKIRILQNDKHGLPYVTRFGIEHSRGDVVGILDSDDKLYPESIETSMKYYDDPDVGFTWSKVKVNKHYTKGGPVLRYKDLFSAFMASGWWQAQHFKTFSKEWYYKSSEIDKDIPYATDFSLTLCMAESGCRCVFIPRILYWYRSNRNDSISNSDNNEQYGCYLKLKSRWRERNKGSRPIKKAGGFEDIKRKKNNRKTTSKNPRNSISKTIKRRKRKRTVRVTRRKK